VRLAGFADLGRCRVMGVLNVTPDSFSDGGRWLDPSAALAHGRRLLRDGADIIDIGGESTRPGAQRVDAAEELARVLPVVAGLVAESAVVSIDTTRAEVAEAALDCGAVLVNDVSGGAADAAMAPLVADRGCPYVVMHSRGPSRDMAARAVYTDVVEEVLRELSARIAAVVAAGVAPEQLVVDPGLGFAKAAEHDWALLAAIPHLRGLGRPLLVGASRKSFLGRVLAEPGAPPRPAGEREAATTAVSALAALGGAWAVRVHEVAASRDAVRVAAAWDAAR
jgi:dihydropteroate synthase